MDIAKDTNDGCTITCLPDEIISTILKYMETSDIVSFSGTCKRFREIVENNNCLWKRKYFETLPPSFQKFMGKDKPEVDWFHELKQYYELKNQLVAELISMSPRYHWRDNEISLEEVRHFFTIATRTEISYYYTIIILQDIVRTINKAIEGGASYKPAYSLTITYYAKIVLRHLVHTYLGIKWVKQRKYDEIPPELVVTFFVQWVDPTNMYTDDEVNEKIEEIVEQVKNILKEWELTKYEIFCQCKEHSATKTLLAVSEAIFKRGQMTVTPTIDIHTVGLARVINDKHGNIIATGIIYQAVADRLGVYCDLNAFPNHFFLEWKCSDDSCSRSFTIDLSSGEFKPKRQCPFATNPNMETIPKDRKRYHPDNLLQFIYSAYVQSKGSVQDWEYRNATLILDFLGRHVNDHNPYKHFFPLLHCDAVSPATLETINLKCMDKKHREMIRILSDLNDGQLVANKNFLIKEHHPDVQYAVGMVCYHLEYYYMCVIRDWVTDLKGLEITERYSGKQQPVYIVTAEDQSKRMVPQEKLKHMNQPRRMKNIEECLGKDFTHFDGYSYALNDEKSAMYPDDASIVELYRNRSILENKS